MQVVPENLNITNGYQVFETPDALYINNQAYDKFTMEPKPFDFFNINYKLNHKNMLKYQVNLLEYQYVIPFKEPNYQYIIQDNQDTNIFYCLTEVGATDSNQYICKFKKENNQWELLNNVQSTGYGFSGEPTTVYHYKILGQTKDYLILYQERTGANRSLEITVGEGVSTYAEIYHSFNYVAVSKNNMSVKTLNIQKDARDLGIFIIKEFESYIYILENITNWYFRIVKYNPSTNTRTVILSLDIASKIVSGTWRDVSGISNIIEFRNKYYCLWGPNRNDTAYGRYYVFLVFNINFDNDTATVDLMNVDNLKPYLPMVAGATGPENGQFLKVSLKNIDDKYIHITLHDNANAVFWAVRFPNHTKYTSPAYGYIEAINNNIFTEHHRSILCKIDDNNTVYGVTQINELQGYKIQGILYYDQYTPIFITSSGILGFKFNKETEVFEQIINKSGNYYTIGLDENNMLYLFDSNDNCETYGKNTANELKAEFEYESYNYDDQNINSYIKIYAKNFIKDYIKTKVKLTLTGQCYFNQNNQKELITYTDKNGIKNIPITIIYGGVLNCDIQELE